MLRRKKVAGCLAEARDGAVVLGIGVNVGQTPAELPHGAGSIRTLTGRTWDREELLSTLLEDLGGRYAAWREGGLDAVYEGLGPRDFLRGRQVTVNGTNGVVTMIDRDGRLEIAVGHGDLVTVESGEVVYEDERDWPDPDLPQDPGIPGTEDTRAAPAGRPAGGGRCSGCGAARYRRRGPPGSAGPVGSAPGSPSGNATSPSPSLFTIALMTM